jgi:hypothetical protein
MGAEALHGAFLENAQRMPSGVRTSWAMIAAISPTTASLPARIRCSRERLSAASISPKARLSSRTSATGVSIRGAAGTRARSSVRAKSVSWPMGLTMRADSRAAIQPASSSVAASTPRMDQASRRTGANAVCSGSTINRCQPSAAKWR